MQRVRMGRGVGKGLTPAVARADGLATSHLLAPEVMPEADVELHDGALRALPVRGLDPDMHDALLRVRLKGAVHALSDV